MIKNRIRVSKFLSYILRHRPIKYGLRLDEHGFVEFERVLEVLKTKFSSLEEEDIKNLIADDPKQRFHLKENKIRACYGHSFMVQPLEECENVPEILFHGTSPASLSSILKEGLRPKKRQFVPPLNDC